MTISVYKITHAYSQKFYLGYSVSTEKRFANHKNMLRRGVHHCIHLQRAWDKYGEGEFRFSILDVCKTKEEAIEKEQMYLDAEFDGGAMYNSANSNDPLETMKYALTKEAISKNTTSKRKSRKFIEALEINRLLAKLPSAQKKRVETTRKNGTFCAGQRVPVIGRNIQTGITKRFISIADAAKAIGSFGGNVHSSCNGTRNSVNGWTFMYEYIGEIAA